MPKPSTPKSDLVRRHLVIFGRVQGVGYRYFAQEAAEEMGLGGWVRNGMSGTVEAEVEGPKDVVDRWIECLRQGPSLSKVERIDLAEKPCLGKTGRFSILY
jgi:acylphosphatase